MRSLKIILAAAAMFAGAAGAANPPVDPRPDPDACTLLSAMDLEPLLFSGTGGVLDGYSNYPAPGMSTCRWQGMPRNHAADAVPRNTTLAFYHIADARHAQAQLDRQKNTDARPSMAITGKGDDRIVRLAPTIVMARHGADIATIDARGAEIDRPDQLEVRYLLDSLALKAAGATVKPPPWVDPDHVAKMVPLAPTGSAGGWTPPPHQPAAGAAMLDPVIHLIKTIENLGFGLFIVMPLIVAAMVIWPSRHRWPALAGVALIALLILNTLIGADLVNALIDRYGATGAAMVTGSFATSTQYNRHDVIGYRVLIGTVDHRVVEAQFRTDDFNVRGLDDTSIYPGPGDVFTVRYLPGHPQDFIIRNDDESPWARKLACERLANWRSEAERRVHFAPGNVAMRNEFDHAIAVARQAGCLQ